MAEHQQDDLSYRARRYSCLKYTLAIADTAYTAVLLLTFLNSGASKGLALWLAKTTSNNYLTACLYVLISSVFYCVLMLPLNFYGSHVLEHKFGLSQQKIIDWLNDQLKAWVIFYIIAMILVNAFYYILRHYITTWWLIVSLFWIFLSLILARLTPMVIIPLFFKYTRLSDGALRDKILRLSEKMRIKILDVFQIDFSKKTLKANAAFVGMGKTRRVILADTLKDKYTDEEIEVILAHEFAHYRLKHLFKLISLNSVVTMVTFYLVFISGDYVLSVFGFRSLWDIAALPVILLYFIILGTLSQPLQAFISRKFEKNADIMALKITGLKQAFISMMEKLSLQNLADRNPHPLIKFYFFDHPSVDERIALAKSF